MADDSFGPNERQRDAALPHDSTFSDLFSEGPSLWLKILGGAIATPVALVVFGLRAHHRGGTKLPQDPAIIAVILGLSVIVGAALGGLLSLKDVVQTRIAEGKPVAFPFKLLFGFGIWSLLLVWFPGIIVLTLVITIITLS